MTRMVLVRIRRMMVMMLMVVVAMLVMLNLIVQGAGCDGVGPA